MLKVIEAADELPYGVSGERTRTCLPTECSSASNRRARHQPFRRAREPERLAIQRTDLGLETVPVDQSRQSLRRMFAVELVRQPGTKQVVRGIAFGPSHPISPKSAAPHRASGIYDTAPQCATGSGQPNIFGKFASSRLAISPHGFDVTVNNNSQRE